MTQRDMPDAHEPVSHARCADISDNLPMKGGALQVHHYFANKSLWDTVVRRRLLDLQFLTARHCTVVYVGAHAGGHDGFFMHLARGCAVHMLEPMPSYFAALRRAAAPYRAAGVSVHNFGIAPRSALLHVPRRVERGQATSHASLLRTGRPTASAARPIAVRLLTLEEALERLGLARQKVDLLHINCEGCEWDLLEALVASSGWPINFPVVQFGTHTDGASATVGRYCTLRHSLALTHSMVWGAPFAWERWVESPHAVILDERPRATIR